MAGAGPIDGAFSPSTLVAYLEGTDRTFSSVRTDQPSRQLGQDGQRWGGVAIDMPQPGYLIIRANADLWTDVVGANQRLGISDTANFSQGEEAWTESGGFGGTFSPNAAAVQVVVPVQHAGWAYIDGDWWTNVPGGAGQVHMGAGPLDGSFSPSSLLVSFIPA